VETFSEKYPSDQSKMAKKMGTNKIAKVTENIVKGMDFRS